MRTYFNSFNPTKVFFTRIIVCFFLLSLSCNKSSNSPDVNADNGLDQYRIKLRSLQNEKSQSSKKVIYSLFSSSEKLKFWQDHFIIASKQATVKNDDNKLSLISELSSSLNTSVFEENADEQHVFLAYTMPRWLEKAESVFDTKELSSLILNNYQEFSSIPEFSIQKKSNFIADEPPVDCFCNVGTKGFICQQLSLGFPNIIQVTYGICEEGNRPCTTSKRGCGLLWLESCNGSHCNY